MPPLRIAVLLCGISMAACASANAQITDPVSPQPPSWARDEASQRANATLEQMNVTEKTVLTKTMMLLPIGDNPPPIPSDAIPGAGYAPGISRLGIPALRETDASLGVAYVFGLRKDGATALPSGLAMASTWNPDLIQRGGAMIGAEARAKGFNVLLAGGANLMRDPRNGRTFEYLAEDPLLTGVLIGHAIAGIQSNHIISTIKHFAFNGQETGRKFADIHISDEAAHESDLLAFKIGIEIGNPGAVMCAYNRVHGEQACASNYLLNTVLKTQWRYKGFVMSDWGAVPSLDAALKGLDQQSGYQLDPAVFFDRKLRDAARDDPDYATRLDDMNRRVLWAIYTNGLDRHPAKPGGLIDFAANSEVALETAAQGIVLLRNARGLLPLSPATKRIAVIGGHADSGVLSGGGSSQTQGASGPAVSIPLGGGGKWAPFLVEAYQRSSPLAAIRALAPGADVRYRDGRFIADAVSQARQADVAIVFATKWASEGYDQPDLTLPQGQDDLIAAVAAANPNTIVVLETGNPIVMPWLQRTSAVLQAWYPGSRGGDAIASILFGDINPSGHLPITFPASVEQLPRPLLDGYDKFEPDFGGDAPNSDARLTVDYSIEGSDVGYRWNARKGYKPLFPFGFGLSYTSFRHGRLHTDGTSATFTVTNTGPREGATVSQIYLVSRAGKPLKRLVGFQRVELPARARQTIAIQIEPRLLADWHDGGWVMPKGQYSFALGENADNLDPAISVQLSQRHWAE